MKSIVYCLVAWLAVGLMAACSKNDDNEPNMDTIPPFNYTIVKTVYDGVWTVDQAVVDTARLEVWGDMKIRLPEDYLTDLYLSSPKEEGLASAIAGKDDKPKDSSGSSTNTVSTDIKPKGVPVTMRNLEQGYSDNGQYYSNYSPSSNDTDEGREKTSGGNSLYESGTFSFYVTKDGVDYRILLLSNDRPTSIYRMDTGLWTISIPINGFLVTNLETNEQSIHGIRPSITLYYNAKSRIN